MNGLQYDRTYNYDIERIWLDGKRPAAAPNGLQLDNCDGFRCRAINYTKGDAVTLTRSEPPKDGRADMPLLAFFKGEMGLNGIGVGAVDWMIHHPHIMGMSKCGIEWRQGASACDHGQVYGCGDYGGITRRDLSDISINGTEFSDSRKGLVLLANDGQNDGIYSERCWEHNILVGAKNELSDISLKVKEFTTARKDWTPTLIEFANRPDAELGPLCANWSKCIGGMIDLQSPKLTGRAIGAHINGAHMITFRDITIGGPPGSVAFQADNGCEKADVKATISGGRVVLRNVGGGGVFDFFNHQGKIDLDPSSNWHESTVVRINREEIKPK